MAVRIRKNKTIVCAAKSKPEDGDVYLDDKAHYRLAVGLVVMSVQRKVNGVDHWEFHKPMALDQRIKNERNLGLKKLEKKMAKEFEPLKGTCTCGIGPWNKKGECASCFGVDRGMPRALTEEELDGWRKKIKLIPKVAKKNCSAQ